MKKVVSLLIVLAFICTLTVTAFAGTASGSITITNSTKDATYNIYKIFDATVSASGDIAYTYSGNLSTDAQKYFEKDAVGNITIKAAAKDKDGELIAEAIAVLGTMKGTPADTDTGNGGALTFTGLEYGYYYVESVGKTAVSVTSTNPTATIIDKNTSRPGPTSDNPNYKTVKSGSSQVSSTSASIGETVEFTASFKALNFDTYTDETSGKPVSKKIVKYTVKDIPTGLVIDWNSVKVTVAGSEITKNVDYTVDTAKNTITIPWVDASTKAALYDSPSDVVITYTAEVTLAGSDGNSVAINSEYDDGGNHDVKPAPEDPTKPDVSVKNYNITLKNTESDGTTILPGAKYVLRDSSNNPINLVLESTGVYRVATKAEASAQGFVSAVIDAGSAVIKGLKNGTYNFEQTVAPDGYNKLVAPKSVTISDADNSVTIVNNKGTVLPVTGSKATNVLILVGTLTILAAGIFLVTNKRMSKESF